MWWHTIIIVLIIQQSCNVLPYSCIVGLERSILLYQQEVLLWKLCPALCIGSFVNCTRQQTDDTQT